MIMTQSQSVKKYALLIILALLLAAMGVYLILNYTGLGNALVEYPLNKEARNFSMNDVHTEETVSLKGTNGTVRLVYFYYSHCPDVCPPSTYALSLVQQQLKEEGLFGDQVKLISITFDPERDTQERLKTYSGNFQVDSAGWHFLRDEDVEATRAIAKDYGITVIDMGNGDLAHQNFYFLIDKEGNIREYIGATDPDIDEIVRKIKGLL